MTIGVGNVRTETNAGDVTAMSDVGYVTVTTGVGNVGTGTSASVRYGGVRRR